MSEISDENVYEIIDQYDKAVDEHKRTTEKDYWQGRKDGLRLALSFIQPDNKFWKKLNETSYGFQATEKEIIQNNVRDVRYNVAAILYEIQNEKKVHSMTRGNLLSWLSHYDQLAEQGLFIKVEDACL